MWDNRNHYPFKGGECVGEDKKNNISLNVPLSFNIVDSYDDRFMKVEIKLMHLGENLNGSYFSKDAVEKALPTLANTPILGFISKDDSGEKDFNGHEMHIEVEDGSYEMVYDGQAYGVIPQDCNPRFELHEEKTYLVVDALMWKKFSQAIDILERNGSNAESMELSDKYDGFFREDGLFEFTDFYFDGACILGDKRGIQPAMTGADITPVYALDKFKEQINVKLQEFYSKYSFGASDNFKEVDKKMTLEDLLEKYEISEEYLKEKNLSVDEYSLEEIEEKIKENFEEKKDDTQDGDEDFSEDDSDDNVAEGDSEDDGEEFSQEEGSNTNEEENQPEEEFSTSDDNQETKKDFALSHEEIRNEVRSKAKDYLQEKVFGDDDEWHYVYTTAVYDKYFVVEDEATSKLYKINYKVEDNKVVLEDGSHQEVFVQFLTSDEKSALEMMRNNFEDMKNKVEKLESNLKEYQNSKHKAKAEEMFSQFDLEEEDYKDIKENVLEFSIEEIEEKLYARLGRKNFSVKKKDNKISILDGDSQTKSGKPYDHLFSRYGK